MTENTTMASENMELFELMNAGNHEDVLVYDEKDFEYQDSTTNQDKATGGKNKEVVEFKFESQLIDASALDTEEEASSQKDDRGFHYEEGFESEEDFGEGFGYE